MPPPTTPFIPYGFKLLSNKGANPLSLHNLKLKAPNARRHEFSKLEIALRRLFTVARRCCRPPQYLDLFHTAGFYSFPFILRSDAARQ
mmetsp:Transcript_5035/g.12634  ORF Transcript_5035/g.12634 Transcript_5035/m.12634 type:complete len:88 (+) Transcript_5035:98-361(+)